MLMSFSPVTTSILLCVKPERHCQSQEDGKVCPGNSRNMGDASKGESMCKGCQEDPAARWRNSLRKEVSPYSGIWGGSWDLKHKMVWVWRNFEDVLISTPLPQAFSKPCSRCPGLEKLMEVSNLNRGLTVQQVRGCRKSTWDHNSINGVKKRPLTQGSEWWVPICWKAEGNRRCGLINLVILPKIHCRNMRCYWEHT